MPVGLTLFLIFLGVPILEVTIFIAAGGALGVLTVIACVIFTALLGSWLLREQGLGLIRKIQAETRAGRVPGRELVHGVMIAFAGALLLTPGFFTDAVGFLLFVPPFRDLVWSYSKRFVQVQTVSTGFGADFGEGPTQNDYSRSSAPSFDQRSEPYGARSSKNVDLDPEEWADLSKERPPNPDSPWNEAKE